MQSDLLLLQHEYAESLIMNGKTVGWHEAHNIINKFYDWEGALEKNKGSVRGGIGINQTSQAILKNGYYEVNGFKFSEYYYKRLWNQGRQAPSLIAREILMGAASKIPDPRKLGFFRYEFENWEMIYNPTTKEVWHISKIKKK